MQSTGDIAPIRRMHRTRLHEMRRIKLLMERGAVRNVVVLGQPVQLVIAFRVLENLGPAFRVRLSGGEQLDKLAMLAEKWEPRYLCTGRADRMAELAGSAETVLRGEAGLDVLATLPEADLVVNGLVGAVGLRPTLAALEAGKVVAMANKEPLVIAGGLLLEAARSGGGQIFRSTASPMRSGSV